MGYLLDTDVLSKSSNSTPNAMVMEWLDGNEHELYFSTISIGKITREIKLLPIGKRRTEIQKWFSPLEIRIDGRLVSPAELVMKE